MTLYRLYIDETGDHSMNDVADLARRFLCLIGVIIEQEAYATVVKPELEMLKWRFFGGDVDTAPVILHRTKLVRKVGPFNSLLDKSVEQAFNEQLLARLCSWEYRVITVVIDKLEHVRKYRVWQKEPYHYCLEAILERYVLFLYYSQAMGDVMVESRGTTEDMKLKKCYNRFYRRGNPNIPARRFQSTLTSSQLKVRPKTANIAGLQLADILAYPSSYHILQEEGRITRRKPSFSDKICQALELGKYLPTSGSRRQVKGCGKKLLP